MNTVRIAALLEPFLEQSLVLSQLDQISTYIDLLLRWNARINLTAIRKEEEIVTRHFGESFFLASHLFPKECVARTLLSANADSAQPLEDSQLLSPCHPERSRAESEAIGSAESKDPYPYSVPAPPQGILPAPSNFLSVLDIGSGAGFPALPLKIWAPHLHLTLIESNHKKAAFLREVTRALTLTDVNVITDRAEILAARPERPQADVVTLRAVEHFDAILPQAVTFLAPKASLALLISTTQLPQVTTLTDVSWHAPLTIPQSRSRVLLVGYRTAVGTT
ncbi:MAG TPA: 16S rRNA (guanine(527)-N(7))-methyltransferase RsmG [Terriglobales bacterium]|nr:16S rRNA (guanine(527)-N(7))-methyltransferase RsmG [Terriglobales bacterium]